MIDDEENTLQESRFLNGDLILYWLQQNLLQVLHIKKIR
jgi:hypothetical protein